MADGTSVGKIFLDLIVRDTVDKQVQNIADKAQNTAQKAFSGVEKSAETMANKTAEQMAKPLEKAAAAMGQSFNKAVAFAQQRVSALERELAEVELSLNSLGKLGFDDTNRKEVNALVAEQERVNARLESARERLAIHAQAAAEKQAAEEEKIARKTAAEAEKATLKQQLAAEKAARKAEEALAKSAAKREAAERKAAEAAEKAAQRAAAAAEKEANRRRKVSAAMWKNLLSHAGAGVKTVTGRLVGLVRKVLGIDKAFDRANRSTKRFGSRLREITSGALLFNGIGTALRSTISYFTDAISSVDGMKDALANLKGAAANAASPIIQVLTPALSALANTAATVFSYVSKLLTMLTGKISTAASTASKSASSAKKAMASLAGFDEITRLDSSDSSGSGSDTVEPNYNFEGQSEFLDSILAAIEAGQWEQVGVLMAQKLNASLEAITWPNIQSKAKQWTQNIVDTLNGFIGELNWGLVGSTIGNGLNTALIAVDTFFQGFNWVNLGSGLGIGLNTLFSAIDWSTLGRVLTDKFKALFDILYGFVQTFDFATLGRNLSEMILAAFGNIDWAKAGEGVTTGIIGVATTLSTCLKKLDWQQIGRDIETFLDNVDWSGIVSSITEGIGAAVGGLAALLWEIIGDEWDSMIDTWMENTEKCGGDIIAGLLVSIVEALANIGTWIVDNIFTPFINGFKEAFGIHSPSTVMEEQGGYIISGLLNGITNAWENVKTFFGTALSDMEARLSEAFEGIRATASDIWDSIGTAIKGTINGIISSINGMISGVCEGINTVIRALNKLKFTIPDWVPALGGKSFGFNIKTITAPQIPMLASGAVITQPTLAMMGEYAGAGSNPEIVAPQSIIAETVAGVMEDVVQSNIAGFEAVVAVLREILEAILGIEIGDDVIGQAVARYNSKMAVVKGV